MSAKALRTALVDGATAIDGVPTAAQGAGLVNVPAAWTELSSHVNTGDYTVAAPVCTSLSHLLATPNTGTGVFNRCMPGAGGDQLGTSKRYDVTVTRTAGAGNGRHDLTWIGNDGTFSVPSSVTLGTGQATSVAVTARPTTPGLHSAILRVDDRSTTGIDLLVPVTIIAADKPAAPSHAVAKTGSVRRGTSTSVFVSVPEGVSNVQLALGGVGSGHVRVTAIDPTGMPVGQHRQQPVLHQPVRPAPLQPDGPVHHRPDERCVGVPGRGPSHLPLMDNPYTLTATLQGVAVNAETASIDSAVVYHPEAASATAVNTWGTVTAHAAPGQVGRLRDVTAPVANGGLSQGPVQVPRDVTEMELTVTPRQQDANLDVYLINSSAGMVARLDSPGPGGEHIRLRNPLPGTYAVLVGGTDVPSGTTEFDYHERLFSRSIGSVTVDSSEPKQLQPGAHAAHQGHRHRVGRADERRGARRHGARRQRPRHDHRLRRRAREVGQHPRRDRPGEHGSDGRRGHEQRRGARR